MPRVLLVEDDPAMATALGDGFAYEGYEVTLARDGEAGLAAAREHAPDVIILDVMLPKLSGMEVCKRLRAEGSGVPILMLTARGQEIDKVIGLKLGADDYVTKPFGFMELTARVEALLRRVGGGSRPAGVYAFGDVVVDFKTAELRKGGKAVAVSARELRLLEYFIAHRGEVVPRDRLLDQVWEYDEAPLTRTVDMHVAKLRKKIEHDPAVPRFIVTVHRIGYKFTG
ncbi:MAG TPA: response regulator transcription factor [Candidatus Sulfotelmatobacter sp.]|jgi:DNA-binding response OmpR family regulator|nr:response regulator transcription factor [Candidatus Sulfotelmatobacter sp.]